MIFKRVVSLKALLFLLIFASMHALAQEKKGLIGSFLEKRTSL